METEKIQYVNIPCVNQEDSKTLYDAGDLRIHTISKLTTKGDTFGVVAMPLSYGVGIEWKYNGENYIVISFICVDGEGRVYVDRVGNRVREYTRRAEGNKDLYEKIKNKAKQIVREALKVDGN